MKHLLSAARGPDAVLSVERDSQLRRKLLESSDHPRPDVNQFARGFPELAFDISRRILARHQDRPAGFQIGGELVENRLIDPVALEDDQGLVLLKRERAI